MNSIGGQTRSLFARLNNDIVALQYLTVTQSAVSWTRAGSSPHFTRVTFEDSTNSVDYNLLGHGTASGNNWTLTGLTLPTAQNLYIRARGYYCSGVVQGSGSIEISVRNAFLTSLPTLTIQRSGSMNVVLSWPTSFTGFTLESSADLNTNGWSVALPSPVVSGTNYEVTDAISSARRFYRLRK